jgi:RNA polymerase sigma factor (sigma-70 family)
MSTPSDSSVIDASRPDPERFLERPSAAPWLFGIATNLLRHHWRRERRQLRALARSCVDPVVSEADAAVSRVDAARAAPILARGLASLKRGERDVLLLHVWAELSQAEVAEALELPEGTVRSRLSRARRQMREQISASGQETAGPAGDDIGAKSG